MGKKKTNPKPGDRLRKQAEKLLSEKGKDIPKIEDVKKLIYELQVYQIELEMQNEELHKAQVEIEESRTKYADLYDLSPIGYFTFNQKGIIVESNLTGAGLLGIERHSLIKKPFIKFVVTEFRDLFYSHCQKVFTNGARQTCELKLVKKDGTQFYASLESVATKDLGGNATQCLSVISDITERKQMEEEIKNVAKFPAENPYPVLRIAQDGTILYANPSSTPLLRNWNSEVGQSLPDSLHQFVIDSGSTKTIKKDIAITCEDRTFSFAIVPITNAQYVNLYGVDITRRTRIEKELKVLNESLEQRVAERTEDLAKANEKLLVEIAERRQAEEALRMSENKYKILVENLPQKIFCKDRNSVYVSCNENYARDLHIKPDEIEGKTDYDFYPREIAEKYCADDRRIMESGQIEDTEETYVIDGRELIIHIIKTPIKDEEGDIVGILCIFSDVTEKVTLKSEAVRSGQLAALGELAAGVAHEINNPITGVINCAQMLFNKSKEGSEEKDITKRIIKEGDRIAHIVHSLLSFARPSDINEKKNWIRIQEIVSETLTLTEAQLRKDGIKLMANIPPELPEVIANAQQIEQVFLNIISNARYALNQKYPKIHDNKILEIIGEDITMPNSRFVKITFYDRGTGIPADIRGKIMDPFFTTKPRGIGTGLGLSVSHTIVTDHGGKLIIDSTEGEFTKVAVVLPVAKKL